MLPPGLFIQHEIIPEDVEEITIEELDGPIFRDKWTISVLSRDQGPKTKKKWSGELSRRTLHQGYRYPYRGGSLQKIEPISDALLHFAKYIEDNGLMEEEKIGKKISPDQCIVNEYLVDQNISAHIDRKDFGEIVISFSLGGDTNFIFRNPNTGEKTEVYVPRRSILIMTGDSRNIWTHEIPKRKSVTHDDGSVHKKGDNYRRISLTYRTVKNK